MTDKTEAMDNLIAQDADLIGINNKDSAVLLPCPFCGGVQIEAFHHIDRGWGASWHVECVAEECGNSTCHHDTEAAAIAAWNTRQPTHRNVVVAAAPADRIGGGGGLQCGVVGVATQSDALLEGDAQTILYLLGVRHGREDERAKIAAEASQPTQSDALREENERLREHLISALDTLKDAEVCDDNCGPCNEARAALEQSK